MLLKQVDTFFFVDIRKGSLKRAFLLFFCNLLFIFSTASAALATTIICKNEKTVRTLRTDKSSEGGCRAVYTKLGVDQVVGASLNANGCESILDGIRKTLESNVWKCKEAKEASVSELSK